MNSKSIRNIIITYSNIKKQIHSVIIYFKDDTFYHFWVTNISIKQLCDKLHNMIGDNIWQKR